ncbi:MAG: fluoride efflux transporter CrcB [Mariniblastus sp.]|jgi:CrcB protein|nr:fluoride efflux transporter CrcB [Mariniblastus sp.]|tara:strand:+ start:966 stop:1346 length:381 start_codon:yes stop_codon:yes gene_type:complete
MRTEIQILMIGIGGALGAISRFGIAELSKRFLPESLPFGTLIANLVGCFLIGLIMGSGHSERSEPIRLGFGIGFLGALTTFSTFGAETIGHVNEGNLLIAFGNVFVNVLLGLTFVFLGILAGKKMA